MRLTTNQWEGPTLQRLLTTVGQRLREVPALARRRNDQGAIVLAIALGPETRRRMVPNATTLQVSINQEGWLYSLEERATSVTGGWMAGCLPPGYLMAFLRAWLVQRAAGRKLDLFAARLPTTGPDST